VVDENSLSWQFQLQGQSGVVSRQQAHEAGFTAEAIKWRLRSGEWQRLYRGAYATFTGEPSREAKLWAAVVRAGPDAVLSHETAAEVHGLIDMPIGPIHVSVPAERRPGREKVRGVVIHRSRCLVPQWQPPWRLPRTTVEDTVLDLVAKARARRPRIRWRAWITAALQDATDGVHSPLEHNYVHGVERAHGLPTARRQARRRHGSGTRYLDNLYEEYGLCVELDGIAAHPAEGRWHDTHRDNANLAQGTETLRYGWPDATENRCQTAAEIAAVPRRGGWTGTLRPCGPSCRAARPNPVTPNPARPNPVTPNPARPNAAG
jgi:hypothetical protein